MRRCTSKMYKSKLTLVTKAKKGGGDKYLLDTGKAIYVPQSISRTTNGSVAAIDPHKVLDIEIGQSAGQDSINFTLKKEGKTGDDRYTASNQDEWTGDIYLPRDLRAPTLFISITL